MSRWRRKRRTIKTLVLIVLAVGAFVALSPSTWHEAVRHAFGEGSSGATLQSASLVGLRRWLDARRRSIRLADLLIEVENALLDDALAEVGIHLASSGVSRVHAARIASCSVTRLSTVSESTASRAVRVAAAMRPAILSSILRSAATKAWAHKRSAIETAGG